MAYNYTNGDGYTNLLPAEPADTDPVAVVGQAIRQIKAFLNDPASSFGGKYCFNASSGGGQLITVNSLGVKVLLATEVFDLAGNYNPGTSLFTALVAGIYEFDAYLQFGAGTAVTADVFISAWFGKNGLVVGQLGDRTDVRNATYNLWTLKLTNKIQLAINDTIQLNVLAGDGVGTGNIALGFARFEGKLITRI